jgi:hypothetical protein
MPTDNFELLRETALNDLKKAKRSGVIPWILMAVCFAGAAFGTIKNIIPISIVSFSGFFVCMIWAGFGAARVAKAYKTYNSLVKRYLVTEALSESVTVVSYSADGCFPEEDFKSSKLFPNFYKMHGNDLLEAVYKDRHFTMCDAELQKLVKTKNGRRYRTVFLGRYMIIDSDFRADIPVYILDREKTISENALEREELKKGGDAVYVGPDELNRRFMVDCESRQAAADFLTRSIADWVLKVKETFGGTLNFCFSGDKIYLAWATGEDIMETDHSGKNNAIEDRTNIINGFKKVTDFLDSLPEKALY